MSSGSSPAVLRPDEMFPAGVSGVAARFVYTASGLRVRVAESGVASGRPILLLHGWGCSVYAFRHLYDLLGREGYHVFAPDLKGHGLSDKPPEPQHYTLRSMAEHVLEIADALELDAFDVLGHSMGGRIAMEIAAREGQRVGKLLLVNAAGLGPMPHVTFAAPFATAAMARALPAPFPNRLVEIPIAAVYGRVGSYSAEDIQQYRAPTQFREFLFASMHLLRRFDWKMIAPDLADRVRDRSWMVAGELDRVVQTVRSGAVERWRSDGWRVSVIRDVAHIPHEESPDEVASVARAMFAA